MSAQKETRPRPESQTRPSFKKEGPAYKLLKAEVNRLSATTADWLTIRAARTVRDLEWWLGRSYPRRRLTALLFMRHEEGWRVVVKAEAGRRRWVAFIEGRTFAETLWHVADDIHHRKLRWKPDKRS